MEKLLSVIMPVYNGSKYVQCAIDSILTQTFKDYELIIINDGSLDNTEEIILSYTDSRIVYLKNNLNKGLTFTRNKGIEHANSKYIAWMDADDIALPERLKKQIDFLEENDSYDLCFTNLQSINEDNIIISGPWFNEKQMPVEWDILWKNPIPQPTVMLRASSLKLNNLKYREEYPPAEDYDLWTRLILKSKMKLIDDVLLFYRISGNSAYHSNELLALNNSLLANRQLIFNLTGEEPPFYHAYLTIFYQALHPLEFVDIDVLLKWTNKLLHIQRNKWYWDVEEYKKIKKNVKEIILRYLQNIDKKILVKNIFQFRKLGLIPFIKINIILFKSVLSKLKLFLLRIKRYIFKLLLLIYLIGLSLFSRSCKTKNKQILIASDFCSFGGVRSHFLQLVNFYKSQSYDICCVLYNGSYDDDIKEFFEKSDIEVVLIDFCNEHLNRVYKETIIFNKLIKKRRPRFCVASVGGVGLFSCLFVLSPKLYYIIHTMPEKKIDSYDAKIMNLFIRGESKIVTVSQAAKKSIQNYVFYKRKSVVEVVYNYVESKNILLKKDQDEIVILTLGHVVEYKNPLFWIDVAIRVIDDNSDKKVKFIWAGTGDLHETCKNYVNKIKRNDRIQFIGFKKNIDLLYSKSDIYFQPSLLESHGISVIEAMSYGIPCVVSNVGGLPESIRDRENGFVFNVNDVRDATNAINTLIANYDLRIQMGNAGKVFFERMFSKNIWENKMRLLHGIACE